MDLTQDIEPSLLHAVDKVNKRAGRPWLVHEQEDLRSPELDVRLARVEEEEILSNLVEDEGLTDGTPVCLSCWGEDVEGEGE